MSKKRLNLGLLIGGLALVAVGVLILCNKEAFVKIVVVCASIAALADGLYTLFVFRKWQFADITRKLTLIKGIAMTASGIIGIVMPLVAARTVVTVVVYVFAVMLIYSAFVSLQDAFVLKSIDKDIPRGHFYVEAVFSTIIAVIFFADPYKILNAFVQIVAIAAIIIGVGFLFYSFLKNSQQKM